MRSNIQRRLRTVESHDDVVHADLDYSDGGAVIIALLAPEADREAVLGDLSDTGLRAQSRPKWVGVGHEVRLDVAETERPRTGRGRLGRGGMH